MNALIAHLILLALVIYHGLSSMRNLRRAHDAELALLGAKHAAKVLYMYCEGSAQVLETIDPSCQYAAFLRRALEERSEWKT